MLIQSTTGWWSRIDGWPEDAELQGVVFGHPLQDLGASVVHLDAAVLLFLRPRVQHGPEGRRPGE